MSSTIIAKAWITGRDNIGVIITHDPDNYREPYKARIGSVKGNFEGDDLEYLRTYGTKFSLTAAIHIVNETGIWYKPHDYIDIYRHMK